MAFTTVPCAYVQVAKKKKKKKKELERRLGKKTVVLRSAVTKKKSQLLQVLFLATPRRHSYCSFLSLVTYVIVCSLSLFGKMVYVVLWLYRLLRKNAQISRVLRAYLALYESPSTMQMFASSIAQTKVQSCSQTKR